MVGKKAHLRTLEAFLALIMTFTFLTFILPVNTPTVKTDNLDLLDHFSQDQDFRDCIIRDNLTCAKNLIDTVVPSYYNHTLSTSPVSLNVSTNIVSESTIIAKDHSNYTRLYLYYFKLRQFIKMDSLKKRYVLLRI